MPSASKSPVRSKVTDTLQVFDVLGIDVAFAGDRLALHLYTARGKRVALMPLSVFLEKARAACDCNGHQFPPAHHALRIEDVIAPDADGKL